MLVAVSLSYVCVCLANTTVCSHHHYYFGTYNITPSPRSDLTPEHARACPLMSYMMLVLRI